MRSVRLGIVGGCLTHQSGIPFSLLYHQVLSRKLTEMHGLKLRPLIDGAFGTPLDERVTALADRHPDFVLVHVRSGPTVLSSALYRRRTRTDASTPAHTSGGPRRDLGDGDSLPPGWMHQGNLALGMLLGRHWRVSARKVGEAVAATEAAARVAVVPVVMGPTGVLRGPADQLVCRTLNRALRRASQVHGFAFVDVLDGWDRSFSLPDGTHLTVLGHRHVADRLSATIGPQVAARDWGGDRAPESDEVGLAQGVQDASLR